jgi:hypothetical protein
MNDIQENSFFEGDIQILPQNILQCKTPIGLLCVLIEYHPPIYSPENISYITLGNTSLA